MFCVVKVCVHTVLPYSTYSTYRAVCCVLYRFVFTQCCFIELCVVCCTGLCSHSAALQHLQSCVLCVVPDCVYSAAFQHLQSCVLCVVPFCVHTVLLYRAVCCVLYRFVFTQCCLTALTELCVFCCTGLCSHSATLQHLQSGVLCAVPVCVHTVLPYSTYSTYRAPHSHSQSAQIQIVSNFSLQL